MRIANHPAQALMQGGQLVYAVPDQEQTCHFEWDGNLNPAHLCS